MLHVTMVRPLVRLSLLACLTACGGEEPGPGSGPGDGGLSDGSDANVPITCVDATGSGTAATHTLEDGADKATVTVGGSTCQRSYVLHTTAPLRDNQPANPRTIQEAAGAAFVRTHNDLFDALYALALDEAKECSVDAIQDYAFDNGSPIDCPPGGCFETGRLWKYVWTRDTAYAVDLGLAALDPARSLNSLEFKLSQRRTGGDRQIVQDTGSGGSYPVSSDRVVWALGAWELLKFLDGAKRTAFRDIAFEAMQNTIEHDRVVVWDSSDGLYRGEQSFLDWREQSYPSWTATDTVHLGMSKALSTNAGHLAILDIAAKLAAEKGDAAASAKYGEWAEALRVAMRTRLYLPDEEQFSSFVTTHLDQAPVRRWDALGTALSVLVGAATDDQAKAAIASYPMLERGVPVLWPQLKDIPIYHNRGIWPFVTAYVARAARQVRNDAVVDNSVYSLMRGAALNLSNMENLEMVSGKPWVEEGDTSGPVVNSQRQLWSVAGYVSMVHDIVFGLDATQEGVRFQPYITRKMRSTLFANAESIALNDFLYKGRKLTVVVHLPAVGSSSGGAYRVDAVRLDGETFGDGFASAAQLTDGSRFDIDLVDDGEAGSPIRLVTDVGDYKNLFGPHSPTITALAEVSGNLQLAWSPNGELPSEVEFSVYRDGVRVADSLPGSTTTWTDPNATATSPSHCYAVEATFTSSKNHSQHSAPRCWWGAGDTRVRTVQATDFVVTGGTLVNNHGRWHYENWGAPGHTIAVTGFVPDVTGAHLIQVTAGNGAGAVNTGITCGVKLVQVRQGANLVATGRLLMPHQPSWSEWKDSSFVLANLTAGTSYDIVLEHDDTSVNMSYFAHFEQYTGGLGGLSGSYSNVNVAELKVLQLGP